MPDSVPPKRMHFGKHVGIKFQEAANGRSRFVCELQAYHLNPNGIVHGGVTYTLVDQAMGSALYSALGQTEYASTLEIKINYVRAAITGLLICDGWLVEREGDLAHLEADVSNEGKLIAKALGTYMVLPRKKPKYSVEQSVADATGSKPAGES